MPALSCPAGTSSILAGAALAAVQRAAGRVVGAEALVHAVLHLEQVLTTGRGVPLGRTGLIATDAPLDLQSAHKCAGLHSD